MRSVNACATKAPNGDALIFLDVGLLSMAHFYLETKPTCFSIANERGMHASEEYLLKAYQFVLHYYEEYGELDFLEPDPGVKVPVAHGMRAILYSMAIEAFVICHELGHIYSRHLDAAPTRTLHVGSDEELSAEVYQLSWDQEYEADGLGWEWYQQGWASIPGSMALEPLAARTAPLFLFEYMALIETNVPGFQNRLSSHPPAKHRVAKLLEKIHAEGDQKLFQSALEEARIIFTMPTIEH